MSDLTFVFNTLAESGEEPNSEKFAVLNFNMHFKNN